MVRSVGRSRLLLTTRSTGFVGPSVRPPVAEAQAAGLRTDTAITQRAAVVLRED
jgi:hypothetical protein